MSAQEIGRVVQTQREWFRSGATLDTAYRLRALTRLEACIRRRQQEIETALRQDLGKSGFESYMCETGLVLSELRWMRKRLKALAKPKRVPTPLAHFPACSRVEPSPYGAVLIMSPWNYPFLLTLDPLIDAIAAGNTAVVKPSAYAPHTSALLSRLLAECFPPEYVTVVTGGRRENACLLEERFDLIFFTGSQSVGREVMTRAAEHLTPVILELGGKSPCIVEKSADLKLTARRIVFGKFLNCGQTCVAPDYILCDASVRVPLLECLKAEIRRQFGKEPLKNPHYGKIVNEKHFDRLMGLLDMDKVVCGGESSRSEWRIAPTVLDGVAWGDAVMKEEIFGPILPVLTYEDLDQALESIRTRPAPLALYFFTQDRALARRFMARCRFGGGCINDVIVHLATSEMGFGGIGASGMGAYHGAEGFRAFSHYKSVVERGTWLDPPVRYQPYRAVHQRLMRLILR